MGPANRVAGDRRRFDLERSTVGTARTERHDRPRTASRQRPLQSRSAGANYFSLALDRADAAKLLAPIPQAAGAVSGQVSLAVRGTIGRSIHGSGSVTLPRGSLGGADISELRVPFDYSVAPGRSRITIRDATSLAGTGRIQSNLELNVTETMRVAGQIRMIDIPIRACRRRSVRIRWSAMAASPAGSISRDRRCAPSTT